eukprot:366338-Chlamydomonas_euryale.AAC.3
MGLACRDPHPRAIGQALSSVEVCISTTTMPFLRQMLWLDKPDEVKASSHMGSKLPPRPPRPSDSVILTGVPPRTTAHWAAAGSQRAAAIPVIEAFNPYVNWP